MPHFTIELNSNGTVREILKDGQPHAHDLTLEQLFSVVTIYFKLAAFNLQQQSQQHSGEGLRHFGLQAFLMSLTGLEAFTNVYFHLRAQELDDNTILERVHQAHGSLSRKLRELIDMTPDGAIVDQERLMSKVFELSQLRNEIVHPRWEPSSVTLSAGAIGISGLVENRQALFENHEFCREVLLWCLLVVARIAEARAGTDVTAFLFHWTGNYGLSLATILTELGEPT